jgi:hypothetical protein
LGQLLVVRLRRWRLRAFLWEREIRFVVRPYLDRDSEHFEVVSAPDVFSQAASLRGHPFVAGPAGRSVYDSGGVLLRQYLAGRELPSSPLGDARERQLIVGTATAGTLVLAARFFSISIRQMPRPAFFSGSLASLSSTLVGVSSARIAVHEMGDR